ncbi:histone-lysine N-methyltransferase, H3 lysine-9 specific SUVH1-like [Punica granatum]|uniref:Histone-lysine N-methyltransferase, H3 lysine-9 specific SUVH1-like n=1 Tax=Punica granatum TaxID=22663 RepID=A0A6P8CYM1_PUNGR|nr:histone-lysine N-methyltransferase, H3 lysine-9 specific SUVH1-like [Punica granatum]
MDRSLGRDSGTNPGSYVDKSRVLDVRPLRCIEPVFPTSNYAPFLPPQAPGSFVCPGPAGPFPPPVSSFYPYFVPPEALKFPEQSPQTPIRPRSQNLHLGINTPPISVAVPINTYRAQETTEEENGGSGSSRRTSIKKSSTSYGVGDENGHDGQIQTSPYLSSFSMHVAETKDGSKGEKKRGRPPKKAKGSPVRISSPNVDTDAVAENILNSSAAMVFDTFRRADGDPESVAYILRLYDLLRWKITQIEESKEPVPGVTRRPDLRSGTILMNKGIRTNVKKRIGPVPGVQVGDLFFVRMELCLIGLHAPIMAGIDYMGLRLSQDEEPVAVSIVSSGGYEDNMEDGDALIYSGQGGNVYRKTKEVTDQKGGNIYRKTKEVTDQKLERGNLALEKSASRGNEIRVIRGIKDVANPTGKVYVYDGLYKIQESWVDRGKSGCNVFKYKLVRLPGQPEAFTLWKSIQQWRDSTASRDGVILPDLTSGAESFPVSLVNNVDSEKGPAHFTYVTTLSCSHPVNPPEPGAGCSCTDGCQPGNLNCPCIQKNGGFLPYTSVGVLINRISMIYECGVSCRCLPSCRNRLSQNGLKVRLEVFKTKDRGWGLRSWDPIRSGGFICEYTGEMIDRSELDKLRVENEDEYVFDATRTYQPLEVLPGDCEGVRDVPFPLIISSRATGNVARFMNHSCSPNVSWQLVTRAHSSMLDVHVVFYALRHIPPLTELTYDYGTVQPENEGQRQKVCLCGSSKCRGYFY